MQKFQARSAKLQTNAASGSLQVQARQNGPAPMQQVVPQQVVPQAVYRRVGANHHELAPAHLLAMQRTVGNRMVQRIVTRPIERAIVLRQSEAIQREPKPEEDEKKAAQKPPPGGTVAEGSTLNDATITAVKEALKKAKTKRYIVYKDIVKVGGTLAWRANNPGNLRSADTKIASVSGAVGKFAVFATMDDGRAAQKSLYLKTYGAQKVRDAVAKLTPSSENDTKQYLKDLQAQGVKLDDTVESQIDKFMEAVRKNEGMQAGIEVPRSPEPAAPPP